MYANFSKIKKLREDEYVSVCVHEWMRPLALRCSFVAVFYKNQG